MNGKCLFVVFLTLFEIGFALPPIQNSNLESGGKSETRFGEKGKLEPSFVRRLEESGVGTRKTSEGAERIERENATTNSKSAGTVVEETDGDETGGNRFKKHLPLNVCIKIGGSGKTVCGSVVSARETAPAYLKSSNRPDGFVLPATETTETDPRSDSLRGRTMGAPTGLPSFSFASSLDVGHGAPVSVAGFGPSMASFESGPLEYGHSFFVPNAVSTMPSADAVVSGHPSPHFFSQFQSRLFPPKPMPRPTTSSHSMAPQSVFLSIPAAWTMPHVPDLLPSLRGPGALRFLDFEPSAPAYPQISHAAAIGSLLCQPYGEQTSENPYGSMNPSHPPNATGTGSGTGTAAPADKSLNVTETARTTTAGSAPEGDGKIDEYLRKVNEIKEEISQLNRAAQRIVDQQEKLADVQKRLWSSGSGQTPVRASNLVDDPYTGNGYHLRPSTPSWGYSRSNILSFPDSREDIGFFMNVLKAAGKIGSISDSFQTPIPSPAEESPDRGENFTNSKKDGSSGSDP